MQLASVGAVAAGVGAIAGGGIAASHVNKGASLSWCGISVSTSDGF